MALLGMLADFSLGDILVLLASTRKTGMLVVEAGGHTGRVWVDSGQVVGAEWAADHEPATVVFQLLRLPEGRFSFDHGDAPSPLSPPLSVETVLAEGRAKLAEWREIEAVVPTMASLVALDPVGGGSGEGDITIAADEWRTVAAVGAGGTMAEVAGRLSSGEFDACKAVKALVDAGLAVVTPRSARGAAAAESATPARAAPPPQAPEPESSGSELVRQLSQLRGA